MSRFLNLSGSRAARIAAAVAMAMVIAAPADARPGSGGSLGNRGSKSSQSVPSTPTAPRTATPLPGAAQSAPAARTAAPAVAPARSGFGSLLMGGLIGAGLFGLLSGSGLLGGLGGMASILGLLLQVALIGGLVMLALRFFRNRNQPALAGMGGGMGGGQSFQSQAPIGGGMSGGATAPAPVQTTPIKIAPEDFSTFEKRLGEVQGAYSREDSAALARVCQADMVAEFDRELTANKARGAHNQLGEPKLVQGDLAEAWREGGFDYATVAMKYAMTDAMVDRTTGRVVSGDRNAAETITEVWTFVRPQGAPEGWRLSAIQQA